MVYTCEDIQSTTQIKSGQKSNNWWADPEFNMGDDSQNALDNWDNIKLFFNDEVDILITDNPLQTFKEDLASSSNIPFIKNSVSEWA